MKYSRSISEKIGIIGFGTPMAVARALESGQILVNATFGKNGAEFWVQFMDPERAHRTYSLAAANDLLVNGSTEAEQADETIGGFHPGTPTGTSIDEIGAEVARVRLNTGGIKRNKGKKVAIPVEDWDAISFRSSEESGGEGAQLPLATPGPKIDVMDPVGLVPTTSRAHQARASAAAKLETGEPYRQFMDLGQARGLVESAKLDRNRKNGVLNIFPSRSLVREDFKKLSLAHFQARTVCVADAVSPSKVVGRIACDPRLRIEGVASLKEWWLEADEEQRLLTVTEAKHLHGAFDKRRLLLLACPFSDADLD